MDTIRTIRPRKLQRMIDEGTYVDLIDVRTRAEYESVHIDGAKLEPVDQLDTDAIEAGRNGKPIYVICQSGSRAEMACRKLMASGAKNVVTVEGGMNAWDEARLPVIRTWQVNPYLIGISAFVALGLIYAGISNTCGLGMLLAKMPWNR